MTPRFHVDLPLHDGAAPALPPGPARHVQVLRLQPGAAVTLFDGRGGEWRATVMRIGRHDVDVLVGGFHAVDRELAVHVTLAVGMPANERMDGLVEKATELGVAVIQPLHCERSVLRLAGERAAKKLAHWQGIAVAACEQCGRTRVPRVAPVATVGEWLGGLPQLEPTTSRVLLSAAGTPGLASRPVDALVSLSGPEGGLTATEEALALRAGFVALSLGPRVLRADTAPLALLAHVGQAMPPLGSRRA